MSWQLDVVRLAPIALYTSYHEIWQTVQVVREIIATGEYQTFGSTGMVT